MSETGKSSMSWMADPGETNGRLFNQSIYTLSEAPRPPTIRQGLYCARMAAEQQKTGSVTTIDNENKGPARGNMSRKHERGHVLRADTGPRVSRVFGTMKLELLRVAVDTVSPYVRGWLIVFSYPSALKIIMLMKTCRL